MRALAIEHEDGMADERWVLYKHSVRVALSSEMNASSFDSLAIDDGASAREYRRPTLSKEQ